VTSHPPPSDTGRGKATTSPRQMTSHPPPSDTGRGKATTSPRQMTSHPPPSDTPRDKVMALHHGVPRNLFGFQNGASVTAVCIAATAAS
jgi:hypothetical protein